MRALSLLSRPCGTQVAQALPTPEVASPSPSPQPTLTFPPGQPGGGHLYVTPQPSASPITPPPVPTPSPRATTSGPVFLVRPTGSPGPLTPKGSPTSSPSPTPTGVPTLEPGKIAILGDQIVGNVNENQPGDIIGHVQIFYEDGMVAGDRAHYDGKRTVTVTGHPYLVDREKDTILRSDQIAFDTITRSATLQNGHGESTRDVERGEVYYSAKTMTSTSSGVAHGENAYVTTCENPRGGYHITGRTIDVNPGDRLTITKAVLYLGAAAILYLPKVVIPLRQVDEQRRPGFFPEFGYDQYEGAWVKLKIGFGRDDYYYGYYRLEYFTRIGLGLGYVGFFAKRNGRRQATIDYYGIHNRQSATQQYNLAATETENFSQNLRGQFLFNYNGNYGPFTNLPPTTQYSATLIHATPREQQNYNFNRSATGSQSVVSNYGFTDQRELARNLTQGLTLSYDTSQTAYGGIGSSSSTSHINTLTHWTTPAVDYQLTFDKTNATSPTGIDKMPELSIRPNALFPHFWFPVGAQFYIGRYEQPSPFFSTSREDLALTFGPALYRLFGSDLSASSTVEQFAYGTGDLKATVTQNMSLQTPIGRHFVNSITYNEANNNGPIAVPFQAFDILSSQNSKSAYDVLRFYNSDYYNLQLSLQTLFNRQAQPIQYQFSSRPSPRSVLLLGGSFAPGPGQGFGITNLAVSSPFGRNADIQFITDIDWKNKGRLTDKNIYYHIVIGNCYEVRVQYNENLKSVNVTLNLLAFPSHAASFGITRNGPIVPGTLNF
ncbi:MAG: LPS-assembly protein LptD [Candidatus Eremiobacteraeota bacterium]|nr:LPS-assembly protein LptD [Candidatus Eremiobacteraeota bacterium]